MPRRGPSYDVLLAALHAQRALLSRPPTDTAGVPAEGEIADALVEAVMAGLDRGVQPDRGAVKLAVRHLAARLERTAPGRSVEVRIPPHAAVQCVPGPRHSRGTPPGTVETEPVTFLQLCTGRVRWAEALADGRVRASGERADLSPYLPLM